MEYLSDFNFQIMYTSGKSNEKADILSRREQDLIIQEQVKLDSRSRLFLGPDKLDPRINTDLATMFVEHQKSHSINSINLTALPDTKSQLL